MVSENIATWDQVYDGSKSFQFVADATKMPIDQVNFILAQLAAVALSLLLRAKLPPLSYFLPRYQDLDDKLSPQEQDLQQRRHRARHQFALASGIALTYFCFGKQVVFALFLGLVCYSMLLIVPAVYIHKATLAICMFMLSTAHIYRQTLQQATFVIDITGPLMLMVQRATTVAFGLHDGRAKQSSSMTKMQQRNALPSPPTMLEYFSYLLSFHSIMAGPFLMFRDYQDYITGCDEFARAVVLQKSVEQAKLQQQKLGNGSINNNVDLKAASECATINNNNNNNNNNVESVSVVPLNATTTALRKLGLGALYAVSTVIISPMLPVSGLTSESFSTYSFPYKLLMVVVTTTLARHLYYTAWLLAEGTCNIGGLGYSGTDAQGQHTWKGASNVDIIGVEFSSSFRTTLDSWNSKTVIWLRYTAYERLPSKYQVGGTYLLSCMWHGFYPGYYCTFFAGFVLTVAARSARRSIRPIIVAAQGGESGSIMTAYHIITWFCARLMLSFSTFSFVLLRWEPTLSVYQQVYFYLYLLAPLFIFVLPKLVPPPRRSTSSSSSTAKTVPPQPLQNGAASHHSSDADHPHSNGHVLNGAVKNGDLTNGAVKNGDLANGAVKNGDLTNGSVVRQRLQTEQAPSCSGGDQLVQESTSLPSSELNGSLIHESANATGA